MNMFNCKQVAFILFSIFMSSICFNQKAHTPDNYGPYVVSWDSFELCRGPKSVNLTRASLELDKKGICLLNITFVTTSQIEEVKVIVIAAKKGTNSILWNYRIKDPCHHFMVAGMIQKEFNPENCVVKKGFYASRIDFHETTKTFLGTSFFYGTFIFKSLVLSKSGNIFCAVTTISFTKRP